MPHRFPTCLLLLLLGGALAAQAAKLPARTALGVGLLPPRLISPVETDLWIGAAIEERFYHAGRFGRNVFVPEARQFNRLLDECPFQNPAQCIEAVGLGLNLTRIAEVRYKREDGHLRARLRLLDLSDTAATRELFVEAPEDSVPAFVAGVLRVVFGTMDTSAQLFRELGTFPSGNQGAYGCYAQGFRFHVRRQFTDVFYPLYRALELDPKFASAAVLLGRSYLLIDRPAEAQAALARVPEGGGSWEAALLQADLFLRQGLTPQAFTALMEAETRAPARSAELEFAFGRYYQRIGSPARGISYMIAAIHLNPSVLDHYLTLGELYTMTGETGPACAYFDKLSRLAPADQRYQLLYGISLRNDQRVGEALEVFRGILEADPRCAAARVNLGITYFQLGWYDQAEKAFRANIDLGIDTLSSPLDLAILMVSQGRVEEGRAWLEEILKAHPYSVPPLQNLGLLAAGEGDYPRAEKYFRRALERDANDTTTLLALARVLSKLRQDDEEYALLNQVLEIDPENASALTQLAEHSIRTGDHLGAVNYLMEILDQNPGVHRPRILLGEAMLRAGKRAEGAAELQYVADNFAAFPEVQLELADAYFRNRLFREAIETVETALRHSSAQQHRGHLLLGMSYTEQIIQGQSRRLNADQLARNNLETARDLAPGDWQAYWWLGRFARSVVLDFSSAKTQFSRALELARDETTRETIRLEIRNLPL